MESIDSWLSLIRPIFEKKSCNDFYKKTNLTKHHVSEIDLMSLSAALYENVPDRIKNYLLLIKKHKELIDRKLAENKRKFKNKRFVFLFCRHGHSTANYMGEVPATLYQEMDAPLSSEGIYHSLSLFNLYKKNKIVPDYVFASVLTRTQMTAVCQFQQKVIVAPYLKEVNCSNDLLNKCSDNLPLESPYEQYMRRTQGIIFLEPNIDYSLVVDNNFIYNDINRISGDINLFLLFLSDYIQEENTDIITIFIVTHCDVIKKFAKQFGDYESVKNNSTFSLNKKNEYGMSVEDFEILLSNIFNDSSLENYEFTKLSTDYDYNSVKSTITYDNNIIMSKYVVA
jgi:hypothetical protein